MTELKCPGCDNHCKLCGEHRIVPADNDALARNKWLSGEPCHPLFPQSGVWISYHSDWSGFAIWATEYEAMKDALENHREVGYLEFGVSKPPLLPREKPK